MSTATDHPKNGAKTSPPQQQGQMIEFVPLGETAPITLTLARVKQYLCTPTKSGKMPTDEQVIKFMMMCKAGALNPWVNDAYLVGYDGKDGPQFSLITSHQALLKRAEASHDYDGMESGVIVLRDNVVTERQGDLVLDGETLVGAWAKVYRTDRRIPSYDAINLKNYDKQRSLWNSDKAGMIVKCAEASAMRKAFPSSLAAMYCREEMERTRADELHEAVDTRTKTDRLADRLITPAATVGDTKAITHQPAEPAFIQPEAEQRELEPVPAADNTEPASVPQQQAERHPEPPTAMGFIEAIEGALNATALKKIATEAAQAQANGFIDQNELDQINVMIQEAKKR